MHTTTFPKPDRMFIGHHSRVKLHVMLVGKSNNVPQGDHDLSMCALHSIPLPIASSPACYLRYIHPHIRLCLFAYIVCGLHHRPRPGSWSLRTQDNRDSNHATSLFHLREKLQPTPRATPDAGNILGAGQASPVRCMSSGSTPNKNRPDQHQEGGGGGAGFPSGLMGECDRPSFGWLAVFASSSAGPRDQSCFPEPTVLSKKTPDTRGGGRRALTSIPPRSPDS